MKIKTIHQVYNRKQTQGNSPKNYHHFMDIIIVPSVNINGLIFEKTVAAKVNGISSKVSCKQMVENVLDGYKIDYNGNTKSNIKIDHFGVALAKYYNKIGTSPKTKANLHSYYTVIVALDDKNNRIKDAAIYVPDPPFGEGSTGH